jgi:LPXTG-site transpeptidase (sortase) family protein
MSDERRRQGRSRSPRWTGAILVVGVALVLFGGYLQFKGENSAAVQGAPAQQSPTASISPSARPTDRASSAKPSATAKPTAPANGRTDSAKPKPVAGKRLKPGTPVQVSVPRLGISARVLGIRARGGALIPPSNPRLVGWWSDGARPGATKGSAIITGHTVHTGGGAFDNLDRMRAGDAVKVTTPKGTIAYAVVTVAIYRKGTLAKQAARLFDQAVPGRLVLVTCEDWNGTTYLSNAVVIAKPVT